MDSFRHRTWLWVTAASLLHATGVVLTEAVGTIGHVLLLANIAAIALPAFRLGRRGAWFGAAISFATFGATDAIYNSVTHHAHETLGDFAVTGSVCLALALVLGELGQALLRQRRFTDLARGAQARFDEVFNSLPSGLLAVSPEGRIQLANRQAAELLGRSVDDVVGADLRAYVPESEQPRLLQYLARPIAGPPVRLPIVLPDGRTVRMGWVFASQAGGVGALMYFWDDEGAIQREEIATTLAAAVEGLQEGVLLADLDGRIRFANPAGAHVYGMASPLDLEGRSLAEFVGEADAEGFADRMVQARRGGWAGELVLRRGEGEEIPVHVTTSAVHVRGHLFGTIGIVRDLTERKLMASRAASADKLATLGRLVAGAAHEINNPLAAILTSAELLREGEPDATTAQESVAVIIQEARRAGRIVRDLLSFARQQPVHKRPVPLTQLVNEALAMRANYLRAGGIEVVVSGDHDDPVVCADVGQLKQVLLNLIVNGEDALKGRPTRRIELRVSQVGSTAMLVIDDSGSGVPESLRQRIFEPFFTTKGEGQGTGLGLSVSYGIVREHGGHIWVETSPMGGARFVLQFPLTNRGVPSAPPPAIAAAGELVPRVSARRVLIVDDEEAIRSPVARMLRRHGHTVQTAADGVAGLTLARQETFDIIISDLRMPSLAGPEFYTTLQREGLLRHAVFAVATGDIADARSSEFVKNERLPVLMKPFEMISLLELVAKSWVGPDN